MTSRFIATGYINLPASSYSFSPSDGRTTFKTGDIYSRGPNNRLIWRGRKEDFISVRLVRSCALPVMSV